MLSRIAALLLAGACLAPGIGFSAERGTARPPAPAAPASAMPAPGSSPAAASPSEPKDVSSCRKLPAGRRIVKLNLKPETSVGDLVAWISAVTCKPFIFPAGIGAESKKVTVYAPELMTAEEAYRLFLGALDSVGLTLYRDGKFLHVIEVGKAKTSPIPLCIGDDSGDRCTK
jgi:general secretion pathway protein D